MNLRRRTGRRPGRQDTKGHILRAAQARFGQLGFEATSIRGIAEDAGVDSALVHHYFGTKEDLFLAAVRPPTDPDDMLPKILAGDIDGVGERIVRTYLDMWDSPVSGPAFRSLSRSALGHQSTSALIREFITHYIVPRIQPLLVEHVHIDPDEVTLRVTLVASQLFGLASVRYLLGVQPLAEADTDDVVAAIAPTIQRYLVEPLPPRSKHRSTC